MKKLLFQFLLVGISISAYAQDATGYRTPPKIMADLLLAKPTPSVSIDRKATWMVLTDRETYPSIAEMALPELKIAGLRFNPNNFSLSRQSYINNLSIKNIQTGKSLTLVGMPLPLAASNIFWNPSQTKVAFTQVNKSRVDLYVIDIATSKATKINKKALNSILNPSVIWADDQTLLYLVTTKTPEQAPKTPLAPKGPNVQENLGKVVPSRTNQDMITSAHDEDLFEFFATSQIAQNKAGIETTITPPALYSRVDLSPDKNFLMVQAIKKPFSYLIPAYGFPSSLDILERNGKLVKNLAKLPSSEGRPIGADNVQNIERSFDWRDDEPATVYWAKPLDGGLAKNKVPYRDAVYALKAPFTAQPTELFKTVYRYSNTNWTEAGFALVNESNRAASKSKLSIYRADTAGLATLFERNTADAYNSLGSLVTVRNKYNKQVVYVGDNGKKLLFNNTTGASEKGDLPFLAKFDIKTKKSEILWRCQEGSFEFVSNIMDADKLSFITRRESQTEAPNYFIKNLTLRIADRQITNFDNPYAKLLEGVTKQKISYLREDSIILTGDLYLPKGYNKDKDGPLPVFIWAYPREYTNAANAAQIRGSENKFIAVSSGGPLYYVTQGYAVLDNAEMPIVAKKGKKPNDDFVNQLKLNSKAAIGKLAEMGVGDSTRVGIGGHSYGAFMTANLLAHTNLFKAGIARSGAYNRTLTPFGFQGETRTYWEAPKLYFDMSPFSFANKIKTPLLLLHGEMDNNQGTYPINSDRLFNAIKGHGGTTRLVFLPYESHGYRAKENILHMLWETLTWLDTYVKNAKPSVSK
jgi:dipeptidyl aminopeptidase/acylaminoacyl peptidase